MADPVMVYARKPSLQDHLENKIPGKVAVARLLSRHNENNEKGEDNQFEDNQLVWLYVEVAKNRVFESTTVDIETAYQEFVSSLDVQKLEKSEKFELKKAKHELEMILIMKCCIIAYLDSLQDSEMSKINPDDIDTILTQDMHVLHQVIAVYFKTGMALNMIVNNPKNVFQKCVAMHCIAIRQAVAGERKLDADENDVYIEAMTIIRGEN